MARRRTTPFPEPGPDTDHVDAILGQWARETPDVDTEGTAILGRARRITLLAREPIEAVFRTHGLDAGEFDVLGTLRRSGPPYRLRPTELYRAMMITSGGLTDRLDRLTARGLIRRVPDEADRRSLLVELTEEGRARAEAAFRADMAVERDIVRALDPDERADLARLLRKLARAIEG